MSLLKVHNLTKQFTSGYWPFNQSTYTAVNSISFDLYQGEILGFLGTNGAGKTTTIQMLLGTLTPSSGTITYFGRDFSKEPIAALKKIGYASGYDKLPGRCTIWENLDIVARMYHLSASYRHEQIKKLLTTFGMWDRRNQLTGNLSAGQATRVMLAKAFIADPEIILLDEPTASLDPDIAHEVRQFILEECKKRHISILITSHNMDEVTELCDRVLVLKKGEIIANNTPEQLAQTISKVRVHLTVTTNREQLQNYITSAQLPYVVHNSHEYVVEVEEKAIASFLMHLSELKIAYSQISIDKPTLERLLLKYC